MTLSLPTGPARLVAIAVVVWVLQPFTAGAVIGEALNNAQATRFADVVTVAAWVLWALILVAMVVPRPATLTIVRIGTVGGVAATVWAAVDVERHHDPGMSEMVMIGIVASIVAVVTVHLPGVGDRFVDGVSYGEEVRYLLRPPGPVLIAALAPSVAIVIVGAAAGPLLLADERWVVGAIVTVVGFAVAWFPLNALHRLTNRFLVFVPNGLVVHDLTQMREPVLFVKREIAGFGPARTDTTARDISAAALGLALELRLTKPAELPFVSGRTETDLVSARALLVSPTRPAAVMRTAVDRGITIA
ncbi:MAG: hypothetical protein AAGA90_09990 [Actinomycetota bacterium]